MPHPRRPFLLSILLAAVGTGCTEGGAQTHDLHVDISINDEVSTMVEMAWTTDEPGISWVEYGNTIGYEYSTPVSETPSQEHNFTLLGLPSLSVVYYRAYTEIDGDILMAEGQTSTGALPSWLPDFDIVANSPDERSPEPFVMGIIMGIENALFMMDRAGRWLWYRQTRETLSGMLPIYTELAFEPGSNDLLYMTYNFNFDLQQGGLWSTDMTDGSLSYIPLPDAHHDYCLLADGTIAYLAGDVRPWFDAPSGDNLTVVGDRIVEVSPAGISQNVFSTWDWAEPVRSVEWTEFRHPAGEDWTHANTLHYYEETDTYIISLGRVDTVLEVDRASGQVLRSFGREGDIKVVDGRPFEFQHDAQWTPQGTLIMTTSGDDTNAARVAEYALTEDGTGLRELWNEGEDLNLLEVAEGRITRLDNGNTLISFGTGGVLREVTPAHEVVWQADTFVGDAFITATLFSDFYTGE